MEYTVNYNRGSPLGWVVRSVVGHQQRYSWRFNGSTGSDSDGRTTYALPLSNRYVPTYFSHSPTDFPFSIQKGRAHNLIVVAFASQDSRLILLMRIAFLLFLTLTIYAFKVEATSFYVSSNNGNRNDANAGTDPNQPWASLSTVTSCISLKLMRLDLISQ